MRYIKSILLAVGLLALLMPFASCKKDSPDPLSPLQIKTKNLSVTWGSATVVSAPVAGAFGALEDLTLTFGATEDYQPGSFTASGAPEYFRSNSTSTWGWENVNTETIVYLPELSPVNEIVIEALTETNLTIRFQFSDPVSGGRVQGIGEYRVSFTRQQM